ncbi:hypothetical protein D3C85_1513540 [compost metagenome]
MRGNGRLEGHRIDLCIGQRQRTLRQQGQRIGVAQAFRCHIATGSDRLARRRAQTRRTRRMQQPRSDRGFTDIGIRAGDEIGCAHKGFSKTAYTT